jgi:hypothetical protein
MSLAVAIALLGCPGFGHAVLGGSPEPFDAESVALQPVVSIAAANTVRRETKLKSGTRVREYISSAGLVFAVAWDGPVQPNLKQLLGKYFDTLVAEAQRVPSAGRSSIAVERPEVVIQSSGRMRAFEGAAWIPAALPAGFSANDVR